MMQEIIQKLQNEQFIVVSEETLREILNSCRLIQEHDTMIADKIRLLKCDQYLIVQEKSDKGEILLRGFETEAEAGKFIADRMKIYEDMWDGCGCKIYYYE
ncbi:MAG: hypothetical protein GXO77_05465 [Calditrichaeota bacterium]|nr:hypothetical protein [Calditrichota bacterium]